MTRLRPTIASSPRVACDWARVLVDDLPGDQRRLVRRRLDVGAETVRDVDARDERQGDDRHHRDRHERDEELAVEALANLPEERAARSNPPGAHGPEQRRPGQQPHVGQRRQHRELGEVDQVADRRDDRVAEGVDARPIVLEVDAVVGAAAGSSASRTARATHRCARTGGRRSARRRRPTRRGPFGSTRRRRTRCHGPARDPACAPRRPAQCLTGAQELQVRALRRDERERAVVEDDVDHDGAERTGGVADVAPRMQQLSLVRTRRG